MNIVFYSKNGRDCQSFARFLEKENHNCTVFTDEVKFLFSLTDMTEQWNVLVLDFQSIPHYSFNIFNHLIKAGITIPVVFFNDPMAPLHNKAVYWQRTNENMYFSKDFDKYSDIFELIEKAVNENREEDNRSADKLKLNLDSIRHKIGLTPKMYRLFKFFYKKIGKSLTVKELSRILCENREISSESIYTYISRLRKSLLKEKLVKIDIVRTAFASYQMIIEN